jgi:hypothetical protein
VVRIHKNAVRHIRDQKYYYGFVREEDAGNYMRMWFLTGSYESFGRWLLTLTDSAIPESPEQLMNVMQKFVDQINNAYSLQKQT